MGLLERVHQRAGRPGESPDELKRAVLEEFAGWPAPVEFVNGTDDANTFRADTYRDPLKHWGEGRVTLLGDAAHAMTWDQGQGACQGIEGALLLAKALSEGGDDPSATLRSWEAERIPRTARSSWARGGWAGSARRRTRSAGCSAARRFGC